MMAVSQMTLGGYRLRVNPNEVRWNFKMKTTDAKALGGKVIQILGVSLSDITVRGVFAPDRAKGDKEAWEQQLRFRDYIDGLTEDAYQAKDGVAKPIQFTYPPRGWDFRVFVKTYSLTTIAVDEIAPTWEISLFPFDDGARRVVKGIKDLYIQRLMEGVGWKQTGYNGPMTQGEVDTMLGGQSPRDWTAAEMAAAYAEGVGQG